jgi:hypothetical protein
MIWPRFHFALLPLATSIIACALVAPNLAVACTACNTSCTSTVDTGYSSCNGNPNCTYPLEFCSTGCICGRCISHGGSGSCCGITYYTPVIYPGSGICSGSECGTLPEHARIHSRESLRGHHDTEIRNGYSPGVIMLTAAVSYRQESLVYVFDRCAHTIRLMTE